MMIVANGEVFAGNHGMTFGVVFKKYYCIYVLDQLAPALRISNGKLHSPSNSPIPDLCVTLRTVCDLACVCMYRSRRGRTEKRREAEIKTQNAGQNHR